MDWKGEFHGMMISLCVRVESLFFFGGGGYETTGWEGGGGSATGVVLSLENFVWDVDGLFFFPKRRFELWTHGWFLGCFFGIWRR